MPLAVVLGLRNFDSRTIMLQNNKIFEITLQRLDWVGALHCTVLYCTLCGSIQQSTPTLTLTPTAVLVLLRFIASSVSCSHSIVCDLYTIYSAYILYLVSYFIVTLLFDL
jgi:hypothetical protein